MPRIDQCGKGECFIGTKRNFKNSCIFTLGFKHHKLSESSGKKRNGESTQEEAVKGYAGGKVAVKQQAYTEYRSAGTEGRDDESGIIFKKVSQIFTRKREGHCDRCRQFCRHLKQYRKQPRTDGCIYRCRERKNEKPKLFRTYGQDGSRKVQNQEVHQEVIKQEKLNIHGNSPPTHQYCSIAQAKGRSF